MENSACHFGLFQYFLIFLIFLINLQVRMVILSESKLQEVCFWTPNHNFYVLPRILKCQKIWKILKMQTQEYSPRCQKNGLGESMPKEPMRASGVKRAMY